jgi:hypothetical protein
MLDKIPFALLTKRIGGILLPDEMRKFNFLMHAPGFLNQLVSAIGKDAGPGMITTDLQNKRESGRVTFQSKSVKLELSEDPLRKDGVRLDYMVLNPSGGTHYKGDQPCEVLSKGSNLAIFIHKISKELAATKASIH